MASPVFQRLTLKDRRCHNSLRNYKFLIANKTRIVEYVIGMNLDGDMNLDRILSKFSSEVRESNSMQGLVVLIQTLLEQLQVTKEQLQITQEQLTKSQEKIKILEDELAKLRKTPKRPKFRPNGMQPRNRGNGSKSLEYPRIEGKKITSTVH